MTIKTESIVISHKMKCALITVIFNEGILSIVYNKYSIYFLYQNDHYSLNSRLAMNHR